MLAYVSPFIVHDSLIVSVVPRRTTNFTHLHVPPLIDFDPRPSPGHDCTTSHFQSIMAFGGLSLVFILSARALRHAVSASPGLTHSSGKHVRGSSGGGGKRRRGDKDQRGERLWRELWEYTKRGRFAHLTSWEEIANWPAPIIKETSAKADRMLGRGAR
ncbi:hypothetical protein C8R45DRAFT_1105032 [Mycena sanguinolenta]|nr:hypothetical protein C8R45DRAFT_1105032 [Mycena sanguinolenta]